MIEKGDKFWLLPAHLGKKDREEGCRKQIGTVKKVYSRFALVQFPGWHECFHLYGDDGLLQAPRARR